MVVSGPLRIQVDTPTAGATVVLPFAVGGWAIDQLAPSGSGIDAVDAWAVPTSGAPTFLGSAKMGGSRPTWRDLRRAVPDVGFVSGRMRC